MKISKSKQELARIISENGGWRNGAESAAQCKSDNAVSFYRDIPDRDGDCWWGEHLDGCDIGQDRPIANWHQSCLSRAEYFHLYPAPDADGWIEWNGGECPVEKGTLVDVRFKDGMEIVGAPAGQTPDHFPRNMTAWARSSAPGAIIAYRLHKPWMDKSSAVCDGETKEELDAHGRDNLGSPVARCLLASDGRINTGSFSTAKPTIEQLASDYRNAKDYAERKQQEADAAKVDADAKLKALELAGEALGLIVSPITAKQEHEPTITDWRDLLVCDVVWYGGDDGLSPGEYHVMEIEVPDYEGYRTVRVNGGNGGHWIDTRAGWRFMRRP